MSSTAEVKEASVLGPVASLTTATGALKGVVRYASSDSNASAALPSVTLADGRVVTPLQGKFLRVFNEHATATLEFAFGIGSAPTLVSGQLATFDTGHVSAGWPIPPQSYQDFIVPPENEKGPGTPSSTGATHVAWILPSGASASTVAFYCAEGNVGAK